MKGLLGRSSKYNITDDIITYFKRLNQVFFLCCGAHFIFDYNQVHRPAVRVISGTILDTVTTDHGEMIVSKNMVINFPLV